LIRHGQYNLDGKSDEERYLTELGREQVHRFFFLTTGTVRFFLCGLLVVAAILVPNSYWR
jgi:hypothetical protein